MTKSTLLRKQAKAQVSGKLEQLRVVIEHASHLLPGQGPITAFVHHNTLHAFEDLPFEQAVVEGGKTFGCHPYLPENRYREKLARNRIRPEDIEAVLIDDLGPRADELLGFLGTRFHLRMGMLAHPLQTGPAAELRWVVAETDALHRFREETPRTVRDRLVDITRRWVMRDLRNGSQPENCDLRIRELVNKLFDRFDKPQVESWEEATWEAFCLHLLWLICRDGVQKVAVAKQSKPPSVRHRDWLLDATGEDSDLLTHDVMIRFCAAFLDQGFSSWPLPRCEGFFNTFVEQYGQTFGPPNRWQRGLRRQLVRIRNESTTPLESIAESLEYLGVLEEEQEEFVTQTLLALSGYAGMIWQVESNSDRVAHPAPEGTLIEFLAIRLLLDRFAIGNVSRKSLGYTGPLSELREHIGKRTEIDSEAQVEQRAFLVFQLSQLLGWDSETLYQLPAEGWSTLVREIEAFSGLERRRIYHLAFERQYRNQTLDAVAIHSRRVWKDSQSKTTSERLRPIFQIVCCIDDREESFRRHLEEVDPQCETFGAAGFFAIAMYYRGVAEAHYTPLCPAIIKPKQYVDEDVVYSFEKAGEQRRRRQRLIGTVTHRSHLSSRTFAGGWLAAVFGSLASIPLVMQIIFPRAASRIPGIFGNLFLPPVLTKLQLERSEALPGQEPGHIGYSVPEMAEAVERVLRDIGIKNIFSRLFIVCGHGSSSLNNPHESAYNCGACAGARGGPNARAFAQMANDPRVRKLVSDHGLQIPKDTVFVGAYHNTCDDSVEYFDLELLPTTHKEDFAKVQKVIDVSRARNAHERCRRFQSAALDFSLDEALRHVEGRANDLSQARPEYNHATNALCFVGRREWSRNLFLDRRAFLQSYDPKQDDENLTILTRVLQAAVPVCAGINLEYYFSCVDSAGWGAGNKLPHNITSLLGVMDGAASDLRPGLYHQMIEIHEPLRLLFVIETTPEAILKIMEADEGIAKLIHGHWVQLATLDSDSAEIHLYQNGKFSLYQPTIAELPECGCSADWYRGWRNHLGFAQVSPSISKQVGKS
ncbi:MAG: DUF2309 domain-containing protein [Planctomycetes bacterium]|nr:DUF2309 domain-containing protein [Planctomycetota bacterium]